MIGERKYLLSRVDSFNFLFCEFQFFSLERCFVDFKFMNNNMSDFSNFSMLSIIEDFKIVYEESDYIILNFKIGLQVS